LQAQPEQGQQLQQEILQLQQQLLLAQQRVADVELELQHQLQHQLLLLPPPPQQVMGSPPLPPLLSPGKEN